MADLEQEAEYRYAAFISYRHVEPDRKWAKWLHRALETYRTPKPLVEKGIPARIGRVFRDEDELPASADLSKEIDLALAQSRFLIVVCSPRSPESEWVNQEVVRFREMGRHERILALLIDGEPSEAFPRSLREIRTEVTNASGVRVEEIEEVDPLAADVRASRDDPPRVLKRMALLRFSAALLGCRFDDLRRREQQRQRRRAGFVGAVVLVLAAAMAGLALRAELKAREAANERDAKAQALKEKSQALDEVLRLSDSKKARDLIAEVDECWPLHPDAADRMAAWVLRAEAVIAGHDAHEEALARLRGRAIRGDEKGGWAFKTPEEEWQHVVLSAIVADIESMTEPRVGALDQVKWRHGFVTKLRERSIDDHAALWARTVQAIRESDKYDLPMIPPQMGLIPLGPDPDSGLFEFSHLGSGSIPVRDRETERLVYEDDAAIVFVLVPGDTFLMGAQGRDPDGLNYDEGALDTESDQKWRPVEITLSAFFVAKHECTQAQWKALTGGEDPSNYKAGQVWGKRTLTPRNPVEMVSWTDVDRWLRRHRLRLPTEAQWEYACRAGQETPWFPGKEARVLNGYANIGDKHCREHGGPPNWAYTTEVDDGHAVHAPVGSFAPNAFGLHDVHGNVYELCQDTFENDYYRTLAQGSTADRTDPRCPGGEGSGLRVLRGGSYLMPAVVARSAAREGMDAHDLFAGSGFRPARPITSD